MRDFCGNKGEYGSDAVFSFRPLRFRFIWSAINLLRNHLKAMTTLVFFNDCIDYFVCCCVLLLRFFILESSIRVD